MNTTNSFMSPSPQTTMSPLMSFPHPHHGATNQQYGGSIPGLSSLTSQNHVLCNPNASSLGAGLAGLDSTRGTVLGGLEGPGYEGVERRSTSIAALRLKAREHSAAMELFSAFTK
jgi:hypothetical protein